LLYLRRVEKEIKKTSGIIIKKYFFTLIVFTKLLYGTVFKSLLVYFIFG